MSSITAKASFYRTKNIDNGTTFLRVFLPSAFLTPKAHSTWGFQAQYGPLPGFLNLLAVYCFRVRIGLISYLIRPWDLTFQSFSLLKIRNVFQHPVTIIAFVLIPVILGRMIKSTDQDQQTVTFMVFHPSEVRVF